MMFEHVSRRVETGQWDQSSLGMYADASQNLQSSQPLWESLVILASGLLPRPKSVASHRQGIRGRIRCTLKGKVVGPIRAAAPVERMGPEDKAAKGKERAIKGISDDRDWPSWRRDEKSRHVALHCTVNTRRTRRWNAPEDWIEVFEGPQFGISLIIVSMIAG